MAERRELVRMASDYGVGHSFVWCMDVIGPDGLPDCESLFVDG